MNSAALVYFVGAEFRRAGVSHKGSMFAHGALPGFLKGNDVSQFHKPSVELMPLILKRAKRLAVPFLLPVRPRQMDGIGLRSLHI